MQIFIMRHGEAEMMTESDMARRLTQNGHKQARYQGEWLKSIGVDIQKVIVSPYIRAQETFNELNVIFENQLIHKKESWDAITPYGDSEIVVEYLSVLEDEGIENVILVSHLPLVGEIVRRLTQQSNLTNFYPSTIAYLEWSKGEKGILKQISQPY